MQSIWFGRNERLFGSEAEQKKLIEYTKKAVDFASEIKCSNLVFGCPKNRYINESEDSDMAVSFFREIAEYAREKKTVIALEANPIIYGTNFITTTQQALRLIIVGDFIVSEKYDKIIIGAGLYGLYSALFCAKHEQRVLVLERDPGSFMRATYINQARVHMGYHYPRSYSTAIKSAGYFFRFVKDYSFCIHQQFDQIYATSEFFSWTNAEQFKKFCKDAEIPCEEVPVDKYFKHGMADGAFLTKEYTYDAQILKRFFLEETAKYKNIEIKYNAEIVDINKEDNRYKIILKNEKEEFSTPFLLNSTYSSVNQILKKAHIDNSDYFNLKYELCEIILCDVDESLKNIGLTVMDGPFFSIMPFGKTGFHSLTSVTFTPHMTSYKALPTFECQQRNNRCSPDELLNCNECPDKPESAFPYMAGLARKYMSDEYGFSYNSSLYSMKPILKTAEVDDSRPTVVRIHSENPTFISVLSGKINTVYDLDEVLI